jgi:hypothetical protein
VGLAASGITGVDTSGNEQSVELDSHAGRVALLFLTSSCAPCQAFWAGEVPVPDLPVVLVTPSPSTESRRQVARLSAPDARVIMSSEAWHAYEVTLAPWLVVVQGGVIVGDAPAPNGWPEVASLVGLG